MGLLDKARTAAEQAAARAKEGVQEVQTKRELGQAYDELGKTTFELAESGELSHPQLTAQLDKIRDLKAEMDEEEGRDLDASGVSAASSPPPSDQPPAMPT